MTPSTMTENKPLASIRGIAALYVVFHHIALVGITLVRGGVDFSARDLFFNVVYPGFTAVDAFFVLSGFILTSVYAGLHAGGVGGFLVKRVFRIYPLHLAVIGLCLGRAVISGEPVPWADLPAIALLFHIWTLQAASWSPQSWSTAVEMICYGLFPLALAMLRLLPSRLWGAVVLFAVVLVLGYGEYCVQTHYMGSALGWRSLVRGVVPFALGMALCRLSLVLPRPPRWLATSGEAASIAGLVWCILAHETTAMPLYWAGLIFFLAPDTGLVARLLHARLLLWLGHISFSVYMLHMFVLDGFLIWLPPGRMFPATPFTMLVWGSAMVVVILGLSHVTWRLIEEPGRRLPGRLGLNGGRVHAAPRRSVLTSRAET